MERANQETRLLLERTKITQREVAERCGISTRTLARWMSRELTEERKERVLIAIVDLIFDKNKLKNDPLPLK